VLARISDDRLSSIPQQVKDCMGYVARLGGVVDRVYNLGEHSGFEIVESGVYQRMLAEARAGEFAGLVARDSSRLGRDYWEKLGTLRDLRAAKVELHVLEEGGRFDFEDRVHKVKSWASTWTDDEKKREEIRKSGRATDALREAGLPTVTPPRGYESARDAKLGRAVWRETREAATVRAAFERVAAGERLAQVQRGLGLSYYELDRMLRNRAYTGGFVWRGEFRRCDPAVVPPLVADAVFERVQALRRRAAKGEPRSE
jgi:DNA invertase Pin-like site-specific DNA recombinase